MYKHLTYAQRYYLFTALQSKKSISEISKEIEVHRSTIYRELKRNAYPGKKYYYKIAHAESEIRKESAAFCPSAITQRLGKKIIACLELGWSPEQISGRLKRSKISISYQTVYRFIYRDRNQGGQLFKKLRRNGKRKYNQKVAARKARLKDRVWIDDRPKIVDEKRRIGDWEIDTIVGAKHKGVLLSIVDRKSKFTVLQKLSGKTKKSVNYQTIRRLKKLPKKTITADNGTEFSGHKEMTNMLKIPVYFAHPYASWERGLNEHTNGLVREYLPKKTDFRKIKKEEIALIEKKLNTRPRKVLNYRTPEEVMNPYLRSVALQT